MTDTDTEFGQPDPIYVGIDGSDNALQACKWAAGYAADTTTPLVLVHAMPNAQWYIGTAALTNEDVLFEEMRTIGKRVLSVAEALVSSTAPSVEVESVLTRTPIASFMASVSKNASLVVVGSRSHRGMPDWVLGGEAIRICNAAHSPVMVWRENESAETDQVLPVVVGVDGTETSEHVVTAAFEIARTLGASVVATHVWDIGAAVGIGYGACVIDWDEVRAEHDRQVHDVVDPLCEKFPDVQATVESVEGSAARHLRTMSTRAQLVVVGRHGHSRLGGALLGSVSQNMIHHSACPVLVVH